MLKVTLTALFAALLLNGCGTSNSAGPRQDLDARANQISTSVQVQDNQKVVVEVDALMSAAFGQ